MIISYEIVYTFQGKRKSQRHSNRKDAIAEMDRMRLKPQHFTDIVLYKDMRDVVDPRTEKELGQ